MANPGKPVTFNGITMIVTEWARHLGLKPVTLTARLRKGMPVEKALQGKSLALQASGNWYKVSSSGGRDYEHRKIAEKALGRRLPDGAEVHHADENLLNNTPENLVICPNHAYHRLLHMRTEALDACGDANKRKCTFCQQWSDVSNLRITLQNGAYHRACHAAYHANQRAKRRIKQD